VIVAVNRTEGLGQGGVKEHKSQVTRHKEGGDFEF
jgi:hypothetical protein